MTITRRLKVPAQTAALLRGLHPDIKKKLKAALGVIVDDPECGKALREELEGLRSLRVGKFRIIYKNAEKGIIEVVAVGPREAIYRETYRWIKRKA